MSAEWIVGERVANLIAQALERLAQVRRLRGEVHLDRARQQDHDGDVSARP